MTTNNPKPEWFELADADNEGAFARRSRITRRGRIVAFSLPALLVAGGFLYSGATSEGTALASEVSAPAVSAQSTTSAPSNASTKVVAPASSKTISIAQPTNRVANSEGEENDD